MYSHLECMYPCGVCACVCALVLSVLLANCKVTSGTGEVRFMSMSDRPSAPLLLMSLLSETSDVIKTTQPHNHIKVENETRIIEY